MRRFAALALAAAAVLGIPSPASAAPSTGVAYQLKVTKSGLCLDVPGASTANSVLLQQWGCT
ncbi:RICIN domain-containing protein, partial [Actinoplanes regularis]